MASNWNVTTKSGRKSSKKYTRRCRRCDELYTTTHKESYICPECRLPTGGNVRGKKKKVKK